MKKEIKKAPITISKVFPATHSKAGQPTNFQENILNEIYMRPGTRKRHTIRKNYGWWKSKEEKINKGEMYLSLKSWIGKPYNSHPEEWLKLPKIALQKITMTYGSDDAYPQVWIDGKQVPLQEVAKGDTLSVEDFVEWFFGSSKSNVYEGVIIHFTDFRY